MEPEFDMTFYRLMSTANFLNLILQTLCVVLTHFAYSVYRKRWLFILFIAFAAGAAAALLIVLMGAFSGLRSAAWAYVYFILLHLSTLLKMVLAAWGSVYLWNTKKIRMCA